MVQNCDVSGLCWAFVLQDLDMSPFNVCDALLGPRANAAHINERINLMFQDADLMPLFIAENYINMVPASAAADDAARMVPGPRESCAVLGVCVVVFVSYSCAGQQAGHGACSSLMLPHLHARRIW